MESLPTEADDAAARRERKLAAKVWNDRLKSVVAIMQGVVLILLGVGFLRSFLDPTPPGVDAWRAALVFGAAVAFEVCALYMLGLQRSED